MNNEEIVQKSWWKLNWKWFVIIISIIIISIAVFFSSGMSGIAIDFAQAYSETELFNNAIERVNSERKVNELLGKIEPIDKMAILEGETKYSNNNQTINSTIPITGTNGKARMDIMAYRINGKWIYSKIYVRIKNPPENKQTIKININE